MTEDRTERAPQTPAGGAPAPAEGGEATSAGEFFVPYKNTPALVAYYLGIFSFIPLLGIALGIPAFVLGILGLKRAKQNPAARGKVHAWVGIIAGGLFGFGYLILLAILIVVAIVAAVQA
jgi:hypothetical protein